MKISLISFTANGSKQCQKVSKELSKAGHEVGAFAVENYAEPYGLKPLKQSLTDWTREQFETGEALIFVGASGIAVRAIAPFIKNKAKDPAVIVMDEKGSFVIPLLSGHLGGANELALDIVRITGGTPVITTATDINHKFAVDVFAKKNGLFISRMDYAKEISAAVLDHQPIGFHSEFPVKGKISGDLGSKEDCEYGIMISSDEKKQPFRKTLNLIPRIMTLGIGCRKGKSFAEIDSAVKRVLGKVNCSIYGVVNVATIDLKKEEPGLLEFVKTYGLTFLVYSAKELEQVPGEFTESEYVKKITGVGNVCERAAYLGSNGGKLIQEKFSQDGVTVSIAAKDWSVDFE